MSSGELTEEKICELLVAIGELIFITAAPHLVVGSQFDFMSFVERNWLSERQCRVGDTTMIDYWRQARSRTWYMCEHLERKRLALSFAFFVIYCN